MRGDSLRDLYAKTLAVLGLALLAGAGAIVDYWPVSAPVPVVSSPRLPAPDSTVLAARLDQRIPAPRIQAPTFVRGTIQPKNVGTAQFLPATPGRAEVVSAAAAPAEIVPVTVPVPTWAPMEVQSIATLLPAYEIVWHVAPAPAPVAAPQQEPGFIGGALRKTKDSIVKTGVVTGATIAQAARGVVGAFKKISPL